MDAHSFFIICATLCQQPDAYPCFIAHSGLILHEDGVRGRQVEGAHPAPLGGDSVEQPDILHLEEEDEDEEEEEEEEEHQQEQLFIWL